MIATRGSVLPIQSDPRLLQAIAQDAGLRSAHARVLRLLSQVKTLQRDTPQWEAAIDALTVAYHQREALFDAWMATRKADGSGS